MGKSKITVTVSSDTSGFRSGLKEAESGLEGFSKNLTSTGQSMMKFGGALSLGVTAPLVGFGALSVKAFNESNEAATKLSTNLLNVEGNTRKNVEAIEKQAAALQKKGVIEDDAIIAGASQLATFNLQGETIQKLTPKIADMAAQQKGAATTAEDMVKINNLVGKVMTGNVGALSRYGVTLDDHQKKLLKDGNEAERAAVLNEVLAQNFGKVNEALGKTPEGKMTQLKNQFGDLQEIVGEALIPVLTTGMKVVTRLITGFNDLSPGVKKLIVPIGLAAAAIGPLITVVGALTVGVGFLLSPIGLVIGGIALVAAGMVYLYKTSEPVRNAVDGLAKAFKDFDLNNIGESLKNVGSNLSKVLTESLGALGEAIDKIDWKMIADKVLDGLQAMKDKAFEFLGSIDWGGLILSLGNLIGKAFESLGELLTNIDWKKVFAFILDLGVDILKLLAKIDWGKVAAGIGTALLGALKFVFVALPVGIVKMFVGLFSAVGDLLSGEVDWGEVAGSVGKGIVKLFELVFVDLPVKIGELAWSALKAAWNFITDIDWGEVVSTVVSGYVSLLKLVWIDLPKKIWNLAFDGLKAAWNFITDIDWGEVISTIGEAYVKLMKKIWIDIPSKIGELAMKGIKAGFNWVVENGGDLLGKLTDFIKGIPKKIVETLGDLGKTLYEKGKDLIQGLLDGAGSLLKKIGDFFLDKVPGWIKGAFKSALGISSPSKVFKEYGQNIMQGLVVGLDDVAPVDRAMKKIAASTTLNLANASGTSAGATIVNNYYQVDAQMLTPTPEAGRVIQQSLKQFNTFDGRN